LWRRENVKQLSNNFNKLKSTDKKKVKRYYLRDDLDSRTNLKIKTLPFTFNNIKDGRQQRLFGDLITHTVFRYNLLYLLSELVVIVN